MRWIYRVSIKIKLFLALTPLLLVLIWFTTSGMIGRMDTEQQMKTIEQITALAQNTGDVMHQLQRERGMSAGFIGSRGQSFQNEIVTQRKLTDKAIEKLNLALEETDKNLLQGNIATILKSFNEEIKFLDSNRTAITGLKMEAMESSRFYSKTIADLLRFVGEIGHLSYSGPIVNEIAAYYSLLSLKEQAGIERALLSNVFSTGHFSDAQLRMLSDVVGKQEAWLTAARSFSTSIKEKELNQALESPDAVNALKLRNIAFDKSANGDFGVASTDWFEAQTKRMEVLRQIENNSADALQVHAAQLASEANHEWKFFLVMSLIALLIAIAFAVLVAYSIQRQLKSTLKTIAEMEGDLTRRLEVPGNDELSSLNNAYNKAIENIQHIVQEIKSSTVVLRNATSDISAGNQDLAQRTDEQAASLVETAASMEQISTAIILTADNASEANRLTEEMERDIQDANRISKEASQSMTAIHSSSEQISKIVASIDEISFQTNLLALNAAVEAARAGESGRGFAVVATEVRNLSQRCAREASQIRELVKQNLDKITEGMARVNESENALHAATGNAGRMKQYVSDIARAAHEQSIGVSQVHQALNQLEQVTQQNASLVSQAASASQLLDNQSETMSTLVDRFIA